ATMRKSHYSTRLPIIDDTWIHLTPWFDSHPTALYSTHSCPLGITPLPDRITSAIGVSRPALSVLLLAGAILHPPGKPCQTVSPRLSMRGAQRRLFRREPD